MKVLSARDKADAMLDLLVRGRDVGNVDKSLLAKDWGDQPLLNVWLRGVERHVTSLKHNASSPAGCDTYDKGC